MDAQFKWEAAANIDTSAPILNPAKGNVGIVLEAGGKLAIPGIVEGKAQVAMQAYIVKDGELGATGFENKSGLYGTMPETGTNVGIAFSNITLIGASDSAFPFVGSVELQANVNAWNPAKNDVGPALQELRDDFAVLFDQKSQRDPNNTPPPQACAESAQTGCN